MAAGFAAHVDVVGHHVGGIARGPAFAAGDRADIAGALLLALHDLAEPAAFLHLGEREREDHRRRDAALRRAAGMRGAAEDVDIPAIGTDRADYHARRGAAVII